MQSPPDQSFVVPSVSRDFRALYEEHFPFVWRYMAMRGVPASAIDDLALSVFRIVREHPARRDPARSRKVLVSMVCRQVLREHRRQHGMRSAHVDLDQENEGGGFSRESMATLLDAALEELTEMQREVFLLCDGESFSTLEAGDALGVAEAVVSARLDSAEKSINAFVARARSSAMWGVTHE